VGLPQLLWSFPPTAAFTSFPTAGCWVGPSTPAFSGWLVYLQFMWEVGLPLLFCGVSSHRHFYKLSRSWLLGRCCRSFLLWSACLFTVPWGIVPPPLFSVRPPRPLCYVSFLLLFIIQFLFFPWGGVSLSMGLCWSGPGLSVGVLCAS
jgi:hypothetical protein